MNPKVSGVLWAVLIGLAGPINAQDIQPALAGRWQINLQRSDKLPETLSGGQLGPWGRTPVAPPSGDPPPDREAGAPRGRSGARFRGGSDAGLLLEARRPPQELLIELGDTAVTITDETGRGQVLPTNGRRLEEIAAGSRKLQTRAEWKDGDIRVEKRVSGTDTRLRYTFRFDEVTGRLTLLLRLETGRAEPTEVRLVYDRVQDGDKPPQELPPSDRPR